MQAIRNARSAIRRISPRLRLHARIAMLRKQAARPKAMRIARDVTTRMTALAVQKPRARAATQTSTRMAAVWTAHHAIGRMGPKGQKSRRIA